MFGASRPTWRLLGCHLAVLCVVSNVGCGEQEDLSAPSTDVPGDTAASRTSNIHGTLLAPRMKSLAGPLFVQVSPEASGIDFVNRGATPQRNHLGEPINFGTNSGQHTAGGVCIGDYDAD